MSAVANEFPVEDIDTDESGDSTDGPDASEAEEAPADGATESPPEPEPAEEGPGLSLIDEDPELIELRDTVESLQARLRAVSSAYQQVQDEIANTRERLERNAAVKEERRRGEVVATLFEPHQNLRRSIESAEKGATLEDTVTGLKMVDHQFMEALRKLGLEEVPGKGTPFDPKLHEALSMIPVPDPALDGVVIDVFESGYRIGSTLIRPARVIIGQHTADEAAVPEA